MEIRFDQVARAERHFTAAMLPHLLMANDFSGLIKLFKYLGIAPENRSSLDIEVVAELDAIRDGSVYNRSVKEIFKEVKRLAVPDLFLRWGNSILIVEAKFFTNPDFKAIENQVKLQVEVIKIIKPHTIYAKNFIINHLVLTIKPQNRDGSDPSITALFATWGELIELFDQDREPISSDLKYVIRQLRDSISRAEDELSGKAKTNIEWERFNSFKELVQAIPRLIEENKIYIGFKEGAQALMEMSHTDIENRNHYKASDFPWSKNWIKLDLILEQYFYPRPHGSTDSSIEETGETGQGIAKP